MSGRRIAWCDATPVTAGEAFVNCGRILQGGGRLAVLRQNAIGAIDGSRQVMIAGADHHYAGKEKELNAVIDEFIRAEVLPRGRK